MKSTIIVAIGNESSGIFKFLDCFLNVDPRPLNKIVRGFSLATAVASENKSEPNSKVLKEHIYINGASDKYDFSPLFEKSIPDYMKVTNSEVTKIEISKFMKTDPGFNFVFIGFIHNPLFAALIKDIADLKVLGEQEIHNNIFVIPIVSKESFDRENISLSISSSRWLDQMTFPGLTKKILMSDINENGSNVDIKDVFYNISSFIYGILLNDTNSDVMNRLKPNSVVSMGRSDIGTDFMSVGCSNFILPVNIFRCNLSNNFTNEFVKAYFGGGLEKNSELEEQKEFENSKNLLEGLASFDSLSKRIRDKVEDVRKSEGFIIGRIGDVKRIPTTSLVETLVDYQVLLINSDLHSVEESINKWINKEENFIQPFSEKLEAFQKAAVSQSKLGFISLTKKMSMLKEYISNEMGGNLPHKRKVSASSKNSLQGTLKSYREKLNELVKNLPKPLPYYTKFSLLGVFLGYFGFIVSQLYYVNSIKKLFWPYVIGASIFILTLFIAWFVLWKKKQLIYIYAEAWKQQIEDNFIARLEKIENDAAKSILGKEAKIVKQKLEECKQKIELIKNNSFNEVSKLSCPRCEYTLRFNKFGDDYYHLNIQKKLNNDIVLTQILAKSVSAKDPSPFINNKDIKEFSKLFVNEIKKESLSIITDSDLEFNLSSYIHDLLNKENDEKQTDESISTIIGNLIERSKALVSLKVALQKPGANLIQSAYLFLPEDLTKSDVNLISKDLPNLFNDSFTYSSNYIIGVVKLLYNFPIRSINYFSGLLNEISDGKIKVDDGTKSKLNDIFGNKKEE